MKPTEPAKQEKLVTHVQKQIEKPVEEKKQPKISKMHYKSAPTIESKVSPTVQTTTSSEKHDKNGNYKKVE